MEITGKIIVVLPPQSGVSQAGNNWKKQEYVLETEETYPKKVHFDFFGERADQYNWIKIGYRIRLSFDIESREYNNRWYTSIRGWKAEKADAAAATQAPAAPSPAAQPAAPMPDFTLPDSNSSSDDLPIKTDGKHTTTTADGTQLHPPLFHNLPRELQRCATTGETMTRCAAGGSRLMPASPRIFIPARPPPYFIT